MSGSATVELAPWLERIKARRQDIREELAPREVGALMFASRVLSGPRRLRKALRGEKPQPHELQLPWIPAFAGLAAQPFHDAGRSLGHASSNGRWTPFVTSCTRFTATSGASPTTPIATSRPGRRFTSI